MILGDGVTSITLPDDLEWSDEYAWSAVEQSAEYGVTGALVVDVGARLKGRPITLTGRDYAWVTRATLELLRALANTPGLALTLTLADARAFNVMFRLQDGPGVEAAAVRFAAPMAADDVYTITLNLMEI